MKKSLIALAVLAASGAAMAQSSVTMYGVVDLSLAKASGSSAEMSGNGTLNNGTSRLGVRGVEDLGGGLKASFNFEQGINAETGASGGFQRQAWLALSGGFGQVKLGRAFAPSFLAVDMYDLTGTANYSAIGNQFGYTGAGSRNNSQFMYATPNFGGFKGGVAYIAKPDNGGNAKYDLFVGYANGPISAAFSYNKVNDGNEGMALGASYDFGMFKLAGSLQDTDKVGTNNDPKGFTIGATVPVGAFAVTFDVARDTEFKDTDFVLETKYALSKRTFAYAAYYKDGEKKLTTGAKNTFGVGVRHNF